MCGEYTFGVCSVYVFVESVCVVSCVMCGVWCGVWYVVQCVCVIRDVCMCICDV